MESSPPSQGPSFRSSSANPGHFDLEAVLARATYNDAPRWMVIKAGLEHGPYSAQDIIQRILRGEIGQTETIRNIDTNEMNPTKDFEFFSPFLAHFAQRQEQQKARRVIERSQTQENIVRVLKVVIGAAAMIAILGWGVHFFFTRREEKKQAALRANLDVLYRSGEIIVEQGSQRHWSSGRSRISKGGGGTRTGETGSFEFAMNQAVNMGDVSQDGKETILTAQQIASTVDPHLNRLMPCVRAERSHQSVSKVHVDIAIAGRGSVIGLSVREGSSSFKQCIAGKLRGLRFPQFSSPRMATRYAFEVGG
jgi:hypothetical protein